MTYDVASGEGVQKRALEILSMERDGKRHKTLK